VWRTWTISCGASRQHAAFSKSTCSGSYRIGGDEQRFVGRHKGYSIQPIGYDSAHSRNNDDDVFQGATKIYNRGDNRYGYDNDDSDAHAEYVATRKGRNPKAATGERDSIYNEAIEEAIEELAVDAAEHIFNLALDDGRKGGKTFISSDHCRQIRHDAYG
jgi:hypothetical protein